MSYELLDRHHAVQWPFPAGQADGPAPATRRLYSDGKFPTQDGKARLFAIEWEPHPEQPSEAFPFVFNTGRTVEHWHTRTKTKEVRILERMSPSAWLEMNPRDARRLGLKPHDLVTVVSPRSRIDHLELRITENRGDPARCSCPSTTRKRIRTG